MVVWLCFVGFLLITKFIMRDLNTPKKRKNYLAVAGLATTLLLSLRGENYGRVYDIRVYKDFLEGMPDKTWLEAITTSEFEIGYTILNKLVAYVAPYGQVILVVHAVFCIYCVCRFIYRNTDNVFWSYFFFVTLGTMGFMMTGLRQAIAICICLLNTENFEKKKWWKFGILLLLAYSMHETALIFIAGYFLCTSRIFKRMPLLNIPVIAAISIFAPFIIDVGEVIYDDELSSGNALFSFNGIVPIIIFSVTILLDLIYRNRKRGVSNNLMLTSAGLGFYLFRFYNLALERLSYYYTPASSILLANIVGRFKKDQIGVFLRFLITCMAIFLFVHRLRTAAWADYIFFWEA